MMKKQLLSLALGAAVLTYGCKKDSDAKKEEDPFKLEYSNNSVEQNKKELENSGVEFVKEFSSLPEEPFIDVLDVFAGLNFGDIDVDGIGLNSVNKVKLAASKKSIKTFASIAQDSAKSVAKLSGAYGVYTWNRSKEEFVKTNASDRVEFLFPSTENGKSNNASLKFTYEAGVTATIDGEKMELPKKSTTTLTVDGKSLLSIVSTHDFKADGTPTKADVKATMGAFEMSSGMVNNEKDASVKYALKKGAKTLMSVTADGTGKGTVGAVVNEEDDLVKNANVTLEVMNYKFTGKANIKSIIDEVNLVSDTSAQGSIDKEAAIFNKYTDLVVVNTKDNTIIAKVEVKGTVNRNCWVYEDWHGNQYQDCYTDQELVPVLVFKDGSKQSLEEFGETGFQGIVDEFEKLLEKF